MEEKLCRILDIAMRNNVTDIHLSLNEDDSLCIEMRVNGTIRRTKPMGEDGNFFRYLMFLSNLDLSDAFQPQTGRFEFTVNGKQLALRFALVSSFHRTSGVLRILNNHGTLQTDTLATKKQAEEWIRKIPDHRYGLYVFSGPTGSGKTTTLYTMLNEVTGKKIYTLEDPIEIYSDKYVQIAVNEKAHFSYADGIKQLMRHDPDIVMIGEIRDETAASMAVRCALTGHLVVTSIHSSSCVGAIHRLMDLGVSTNDLKDVLNGISCQRLYDMRQKSAKIGVYEIMNKKEIDYYFEHKTHSPEYNSLTFEIQNALDQGIISMEQAKADLLE